MPSATHAAPLEYDFVVVSNRLPVDRVVDADGIDAWAPSPGGLVTALEPVMRDADGAWVGWGGQPDLDLDPFESGGIHLVPIALSADAMQAGPDGDPQFSFILCRTGTNRNGDHFLPDELSARHATAIVAVVDDLGFKRGFVDAWGAGSCHVAKAACTDLLHDRSERVAGAGRYAASAHPHDYSDILLALSQLGHGLRAFLDLLQIVQRLHVPALPLAKK